MKRIYLDYVASTPVDPRVERAMRPYFSDKFGNAGSLHSFGQEAMAAVDASRETIARILGVDFREMIFTGSATEANNFALRGFMRMYMLINTDKNISENPRAIRDYPRPRIVVSAVEHESVLETARDLEREGAEVVYLPVDKIGIVDLEKLKSALNERTILVSIMYAQNEIGIIQPLFEIKKIIDDFKKRNFQIPAHNFQKNTTYHIPSTTYPLFHTDAAQAFQFLDCNPVALGVDLMTLSGHKIYGPKGVGVLYVNHESRITNQVIIDRSHILHNLSFIIQPLIAGGGQEFGLRSGTENVPAIVGFAKAAELADEARVQEAMRIAGLRDYFWREIKKIFPKVELNGTSAVGERLPNILNVYFPGHKSEEMLTRLDLLGLAASSGSACKSRAMESSYVLRGMGFGAERAKNSIRFSFGRPTTREEIVGALDMVKKALGA